MFKWLLAFFNAKEKDNMKKYLIVGLGNIGQEYTNTRHNIGFEILDFFADQANISFSNARFGSISEYKLKGRSFIFLKPNTYMNLSGKAVKYWIDKYTITQENLLIVTDDLNLPFGSLRLKTKGSDGGHNGLKDVQDKLQTSQYNRLRFGISSDFLEGRQVDYVLGEWTANQLDQLNNRLDRCADFVKSFVMSGVKNAMNEYNNT